jgi:antitoxin (DNA-binding transcriptional repressor) of toxin-antitoxin stability system
VEATTKDLRLHTAEILAAADRGEEVIITYRGRRRAVIRRWVETASERTPVARNPAFGLWQDREGDVDEEVRRLRRRRDLL